MSDYDENEEPIVVPLGTSGLVAWLSPADEDIAGFNWRAKKAGNKERPHYYACYRESFYAGSSKDYFMQDVVWERMMRRDRPRGFLIDHINGDKLNNCRYNLRLATRSDNEANKMKRQGNTTSKYKGVSKIKDGREKKWRATITIDSYPRNLGTFYREVAAAKAYNEAALQTFGEFAYLNTFEDEPPEGHQRVVDFKHKFDENGNVISSWGVRKEEEEKDESS